MMRGKEIRPPRRKLRETRGDGSLISSLLIALGVVIIAVIVMEALHMATVIRGVRDQVDRAVLSAAADNAYTAYGGVREGNSSLYEYQSGGYLPRVELDDVENKLRETLSLTGTGGELTRRAGNKEQFVLAINSVRADNPAHNAAGGASSYFNTSCTLAIPLAFLDFPISLTLDLTVRSRWNPLF